MNIGQTSYSWAFEQGFEGQTASLNVFLFVNPNVKSIYSKIYQYLNLHKKHQHTGFQQD